MNFLSLASRASPMLLTRTIPSVVRSFHALRSPLLPPPPRSSSQQLITPIQSFLQASNPSVSQTCGMKVKSALRRRCKDCYYVWRQGRQYIMCKSKPRHKQMSQKKAERNTWTITYASQSPKREW